MGKRVWQVMKLILMNSVYIKRLEVVLCAFMYFFVFIHLDIFYIIIVPPTHGKVGCKLQVLCSLQEGDWSYRKKLTNTQIP